MITDRVRLPRKLAKSVSSGVIAEAGRLHPVGAMSITLNMLPLSRVSMTLAESDLDLAIHDLVEVYNQNGSVGVYRVNKIIETKKKERKVDLSHGLDVLSDATLATIQEFSGTVAQFLQMIIDGQTQTLGGQFYWKLGTCEDTNPWNKDLKYDNAMSCLTDIAKTEEDYMFTFDQSTFPWTLNFVKRTETVGTEFRLGRNTANCQITLDDSDLCTRLYLSVTSEEDDEEGAGTYINEGYYTYNDTAAQQVYGIVCKTAGVNQEDFASTSALEAWVDDYFARHNSPTVQITIEGMELNRYTGEDIDEMHLGKICRAALAEYSTTFNERIISVNYPDALRLPNSVKVSLANKKETAEDAFQEISETASSASSAASSGGRSSHNDATYFRRVIGDTANGLYSRIEQTAYYIRSEVYDTANGLYSRIEQTASYIRSELADTANGLYSKIEETASYIRAEVSDTANGLYSRIEQTASSLSSEIVNVKTDAYSRIEQTASEIYSEVSNTANGLSSRLDQTESEISLKVSKGDVATQLAVEAGNVSISGGNLVVDGYITAAELDADYIATLLLNSSVLSTRYLYSSTIECSTFIQGEYTMDVSDAVTGIQLTQSGNTYTLNQKHFYSSTWEKVGDFSRAITSDSWSWYGGSAKVTLQPQNQTFYSLALDQIAPHGQATWDDDKKGFSVTLDVDDTAGTTVYSEELHFDASTAYTEGQTAGYNSAKGTYTTTGGVLRVSKSSSGSTFPLSFSIDAGITYNSSTHTYTAKALCDDTQMDTKESGTEAYVAGCEDGYEDAKGKITATITYADSKYTAHAKLNGTDIKTAVSGTLSLSQGGWDSNGKNKISLKDGSTERKSITLSASKKTLYTKNGTTTKAYSGSKKYSGSVSYTGQGGKASFTYYGELKYPSTGTSAGTGYWYRRSSTDLYYAGSTESKDYSGTVTYSGNVTIDKYDSDDYWTVS